MTQLYKIPFTGLAIILLLTITFLPSFSLGVADFYNEKRMVQILVLIFATVSFLFLLSRYQLNFSLQTGYLLGALIILLGLSISFSSNFRWALLEIGWYICLLQFILVIGYLYQKYPQKFEKILLVAIIGMAVIYSIRVSGDLITSWLNEGWPNWPNHRRMAIMMNGENIAQNGFLNFQNVRFFNHLQTWSLPILIYSYLYFSTSLSNGLKTLLALLIAFWWMLVFASGARGTLLATIISVSVIFVLFKKESLNWIKVYLSTLAGGMLLYLLVYYLILPEGPGKAIDRLSSSGRMDLWWETWQVIKENPFLGIGPMQMANVQSENPITSPHNIYLMWIAEWGIPAFLVAVVLGVKGLILWFRESLKDPSNKDITVSIVLLAGMIHSGVSGLLITPLSQLLFAALLGWAIGYYFERKEQKLFLKEDKTNNGLKYGIITGILGINLFVFIFAGSHILRLEENTERFEELRRQDKITLFLNKKWGMFPRFWDQGFIGIEYQLKADSDNDRESI